MKKIVFIFSVVLGMSLASISSCQSVADSQEDEITQMEQVIKKQPIRIHKNIFDSYKNEDKCFYYIVNPTPEKVEAVNQDKAATLANYPVELTRVKTASEATLVINKLVIN